MIQVQTELMVADNTGAKKVECIINLAALIGIPYSYSSPESLMPR